LIAAVARALLAFSLSICHSRVFASFGIKIVGSGLCARSSSNMVCLLMALAWAVWATNAFESVAADVFLDVSFALSLVSAAFALRSLWISGSASGTNACGSLM
jgi:hypothetical protein